VEGGVYGKEGVGGSLKRVGELEHMSGRKEGRKEVL